MTILRSSEERGFFDPITLGLHAPSQFSQLKKYRDHISARDAATLVHELSHYLQFYGTAFGYAYLLEKRGSAICLEKGMKSMAGHQNLTFPASSWHIDIGKVFSTKEDLEFYTQAILMNRYYNEELYGFTYSHFGNNQPIQQDASFVLTSPLYLEMREGTVFPFTGETLLENWAVCQEMQFLSSSVPRDIANWCINNTYLNLPGELQSRYVGIGVWLGTCDLIEIEPLLYFTILNQPQEGFLWRLGDYTLAFNTKKILTASGRLKKLPCPTTNEETRDVLSRIAHIAGLSDPLEVLAKWRALAEPAIESLSWAVNWISYRIWDWFLKEPLHILTWPKNLQSVLKGLPLLKMHFSDRAPGETVNVLNVSPGALDEKHLALIKKHHDYCERMYVIMGLYNQPEIRCPNLWEEKPSLCDSCELCTGYLPNNQVRDDCPVMKDHADLINLASNTRQKR